METLENPNSYFIRVMPNDSLFRDKKRIIENIRGTTFLKGMNCWLLQKEHSPYKDLKDLENFLAEQIERVKIKKMEPLIFEPYVMPELTVEQKELFAKELKLPMFHFQEQGAAYAIQKGSSFMCDQQGLGKTIEAMAAVIGLDAFPALVLCKASLLYNWKSEWEKWTYKEPYVFRPGSSKFTWPTLFQLGMYQVGIANYDSMERFFVQKIDTPEGETLLTKHIKLRPEVKIFKSIIVDESQYVKDSKTIRTKICLRICRDKPYVFCLSGTPLLNDGKEIFPQLCMLNKETLFSHAGEDATPGQVHYTFHRMYGGKKNKQNLKILNARMRNHCFFRRLKSEVLPDLPPKNRQILLVDINNRDQYDNAENNFRKYLQEELQLSDGAITKRMRAMALTQMGVLKKLSAYGKIQEIKDWAEELIDQDEKVVLFAFHHDIQKELLENISHSIALSYNTPDKEERNKNKQRFQTEDDIKSIICSISADAEGHTLTAASYMGAAELPWTFGKLEQMEDRIHRIGTQTDYPVNIGLFIGRDTVDEKILEIIMEKKEMHENVTGSEQEAPDQIIDLLIRKMAQPKIKEEKDGI